MQFDKTELTVAPGQLVEIVFTNPDTMQHNFVLGQPDSLQAIGQAADDLARTPNGPAQQYVPQIPQILFSTKLVEPGETVTVQFKAPTEPGQYPYVCTFPGHWRIMNGILNVRAPQGRGTGRTSGVADWRTRDCGLIVIGEAERWTHCGLLEPRPIHARQSDHHPMLKSPDQSSAVPQSAKLRSPIQACVEVSMADKVRVAIVGLGFGAEFIPIYQKHPNAEMYGICRRDRQELDACGDKFGVKARYTSFEELLADPDVDAVHINSPIADHAPQSIAALEGGEARRQHGARGHDDRRVPADRRSAARRAARST